MLERGEEGVELDEVALVVGLEFVYLSYSGGERTLEINWRKYQGESAKLKSC